MKKLIPLLMVFLMIPLYVFAQDAAESAKPAVEAAAEVASVAAEAPVAVEDGEDIGGLLQGIVKVIGDWKQLGWQAGLAALLMLLLGTMKNSLLRKWLWDKIPQWGKVFVAPLLSMLIFFLSMDKFGWPEVAAAITTGGAAVYLHQIVKGLADAPFVGATIKAVLELVAKMLKKPAEG